MTKNAKMAISPIVTVETYRVFANPNSALVVEVRIEGRPGSFKREWVLFTGRLTEAQELDIRAWVDALIGDAILLSLGVQGSLFP